MQDDPISQNTPLSPEERKQKPPSWLNATNLPQLLSPSSRFTSTDTGTVGRRKM